jgi:hypothetical protein
MRFARLLTSKAPIKASVLLKAPIVVAIGLLAASSPAQARPAYARQTGLACGVCHVNPAGGGPRTAFGRAFARNGHRLPGAARRRRNRGYSSEPRRPGIDGGTMGPAMMGPGMMGPGTMGPGMMDGDGR